VAGRGKRIVDSGKVERWKSKKEMGVNP